MDIKTMWKLLNTLRRISVAGDENLGFLLASINLIKEAIARMEGENAENRKAE